MVEAKDDRNFFDRWASVLEQNIRGVQLGLYGLSLFGLSYALRSVRPFAKFRSPHSIPKSFFDQKLKLHGQVLGVDFVDSQPVLMVDHAPALFGSLRKPTSLPVAIEGVNISSNGVSWLQTIVKGNRIEFTLLQPNSNYVSCIVTHQKRDVASHLVSIGFASVAPFNLSLQNDKLFANYYKNLLKEEEKAERKRVGMWFDDRRLYGLISRIFVRPKLLRF